MEKESKDKGMLEDWMKAQDPRTGKPWYVRFKHQLIIIGAWILFGIFCFIWNCYFPYGVF